MQLNRRTFLGLGLAAAVGAAIEMHPEPRRTASIERLCIFKEATSALDEIAANTEPAVYVVSAEWCGYCRELEHDLEQYNNGSRRVIISLVDPGSQAVIDYANALYGDRLPEQLIPSTIITDFDGTTVFTQGYNPAREQFNNAVRLDGTPTGPIRIKDLFK